MVRTHLTLSFATSALLVLAGCSIEFANKAPATGQVQRAYRFPTAEGSADIQHETFVCLAFPGGGARAAALAQGVLRGLRGIDLPQPDLASARLG